MPVHQVSRNFGPDQQVQDKDITIEGVVANARYLLHVSSPSSEPQHSLTV